MLTSEEVAVELSREEQRPVTVEEVRRIEFMALRKVRVRLIERGIFSVLDVLPDQFQNHRVRE